MKLSILATTALLTPLWLATSVRAENKQPESWNMRTAQALPTAPQVLSACIQNRAETLPIPFTDVSRDHWAFKAVMTLYYCGAWRQATPAALIQKLRTEQESQLPQAEEKRLRSAP